MKSAREAKEQAVENQNELYKTRYNLCIDRLSNLIDQEVKAGSYDLIINDQWYKEIYEALYYCYPEIQTYMKEHGYSFEKQASANRWIIAGRDNGSLQEYVLSWENAK